VPFLWPVLRSTNGISAERSVKFSHITFVVVKTPVEITGADGQR